MSADKGTGGDENANEGAERTDAIRAVRRRHAALMTVPKSEVDRRARADRKRRRAAKKRRQP
jgi:hypothetical protein